MGLGATSFAELKMPALRWAAGKIRKKGKECIPFNDEKGMVEKGND